MDAPEPTPGPDRERIRARVVEAIRAGRFRFQVVAELVGELGLPEPEAEAVFDDVADEERERAVREGREWVPPMPLWRILAADWLRHNWPMALALTLATSLALFWLLGGVRWLAGLLMSR